MDGVGVYTCALRFLIGHKSMRDFDIITAFRHVIKAVILTSWQVSHPYILLTANVDDVQVLAQQLAESPVADELQRIWRRASHQFQQQLRRPAQYRNEYEGMEYSGRRSNVDKEIEALGRNASVYLKAFKKMLAKL